MNALPLPHKLLNKYFGKQYYRFQVVLTQSGLGRTYWEHKVALPIIAATPAEACNAIKDEFAASFENPTEIECAGPKGGVTHRFVGYESLIWAKMCADNPDKDQLTFAYANLH